MIEPGRKFVQGVKKYRFGFNGKENDNEVKGEGSQQDYGLRIYDPRIGRFLSVDPLSKSYPWNSAYSYAEGDPINYEDIDGAETGTVRAQATTIPTVPVFVTPRGSFSPNSNPTQLINGPINSGLYAPQTNATSVNYNGITSEKLKSMIPPTAITARIGSDGTGYCLQGEDQWGGYSFPLYTTNAPAQVTWMDRAYQATTAETAKMFNATNWTVQPAPKVSVNPTPVETSSTNEINKKNEDVYVYRGGSFTDMNFTPRPGVDDGEGPKSGLSTFTTAQAATQGKGGKVQALSVKKLKILGFVLTTEGEHVGIRPKSQAALKIWAKSREDIANGKQPHLLTKILKKARVLQKIAPKR